MICKFCGKKLVRDAKYLTKREEGNCYECVKYCMKMCKLKGCLSWHNEPCVSCNHNPYAKEYKWEGIWQRK